MRHQHLGRADRGLLCAIAGALVLNACTATRPLPVGEVRADDAITVQSGRAFAFVHSDGTRCDVYRLVGRVAEIRGDTVQLRAVREVNPVGGSASACVAPADGQFVVTADGPTLNVTRADTDRTTGAILVVVIVAAVAFAVVTSALDAAILPGP